MQSREEHFEAPLPRSVRLRVVHWGPPEAPPLVLLHGAGANAHWWDHLAPALARRFHVAALDFRGHGDSEHPEQTPAGAFAVDLESLLAHLGAPDAVLIGHSLGAHVAFAHAASHPEIRALVLLDFTRGASASRRRATRLALSLRRTYATREQAVARFRFLPTAARAPEELRRAIAERSVREEPDGRYGYKFDARWFGVPSAARPDPAAVRCPTLLLRGARSELLTAEAAEELVRALPRGRLVEVPEAGHHVHIDQPDLVLAAIRAFLDEVAGPATDPASPRLSSTA